MVFLSISCFLYSLCYFLIRNIISILLGNIINIDNISGNIANLTFIGAIFNITYAILQPINGLLIEKMGLRIIGVSSFFSSIILFFFKIKQPLIFQYILPIFLGIFVSSGSLCVTSFCKKFFSASPFSIGASRISLIFCSFSIMQFIKYLSIKGVAFNSIISVLQLTLFITSILFFISKDSKMTLVSKSNITNTNIKKFDVFFVLICISGIFSSFAFFFFNNGFLKLLISNNNDLMNFLSYLTAGFGFGNIFIISSEYFDFKRILKFLICLQIISLVNFFYLFMPLQISCFFIGASYAGHLLPIPYIAKHYKHPIFFSGLFNSFIMLFSSFFLIMLASIYIQIFGESLENFYFLIKLIISLNIVNLFLLFNISYFYKNNI